MKKEIEFLKSFINVWNSCIDSKDEKINDIAHTDLTNMYQIFLEQSGLPQWSADELLMEISHPIFAIGKDRQVKIFQNVYSDYFTEEDAEEIQSENFQTYYASFLASSKLLTLEDARIFRRDNIDPTIENNSPVVTFFDSLYIEWNDGKYILNIERWSFDESLSVLSLLLAYFGYKEGYGIKEGKVRAELKNGIWQLIEIGTECKLFPPDFVGFEDVENWAKENNYLITEVSGLE